MSKTTVLVSDEIAIRSMTSAQLRAFLTDAEVPYTTEPDVVLLQLALTVLAVFNQQQFTTPRSDLIQLHQQLFGAQDLSLVTSDFIAVEIAYHFWPSAPITPVALFAFSHTGLAAFFADSSTGDITRWRWDFGDGSPIIGVQNPGYLYFTPGTYMVQLTVIGPTGVSNSVSHSVIVS